MHGIIMSVNNQITHEPLILVGIILPEDKQISVKIHIHKNAQYKLNDEVVSGELLINSDSEHLTINGDIYDDIILSSKNINDYLTIESVPTGRGFHWQRDIRTNLPGNVIIKMTDGNIFLINELSLEKYLPYVATAEMNPDCPIALLEAQTISARSWLLANRNTNHPKLDIDVCNDDCCQRYQGIIDVPEKSMQAIENTIGQVLLYENDICDARYSKSCGGVSESFENVWGGNPILYLSSIVDAKKNIIDFDLETEDGFENFINSNFEAFCSTKHVSSNDISKYLGIVDTSDSYYRWQIEYSQTELISILTEKLNLDIKFVKDLLPQKRGYSGRIIQIKINYIDKNDMEKSIILNSEYDIRNALHKKFLYSSAITIKQIKNSNGHNTKFKFKGAGWGHGVGLCQIGALNMALDGYTSEEILKHYFKDSQIEKIY